MTADLPGVRSDDSAWSAWPAWAARVAEAELGALGAVALLVVAASGRDPDLAPFAGPIHLGEALLVLPRGGAPRLAYLSAMERDEVAASGLAPLDPGALGVGRAARTASTPGELLAAVAGRALALCALAPGRVALAGHAAAGTVGEACRRLSGEGWTFADGNPLVLLLRKHKDARQRAAVGEAAKGAADAFRAVAALLAAAVERDGELWLEGERLRAARLRREVSVTLGARGLGQPQGNIVAAGAEAGVPHTAGADERVLRPGEALIVDLYPKGWLFADATRTFCVGTPPAALAAAHAEVAAALARAHEMALPGAAGWYLDEEVSRRFTAAGYPTARSHPGTTTGYVHGLGHGVGFELHELPSFREEAAAEEGRLAEGDVLTLEPGLYAPEEGWGVRLEDLVALGPDGPENLTPLPYDLDPRAWVRQRGQ